MDRVARVACKRMRRLPLTTSRPFGRDQFDLQLTADRITAGGEHFKRRDGVEWVEPVEQHDLGVHMVIVGKSRVSEQWQDRHLSPKYCQS